VVSFGQMTPLPRQQARSGKTERLKSLGRKTVMTTKGAFPKTLEQESTKNRNCRTGFSLSALADLKPDRLKPVLPKRLIDFAHPVFCFQDFAGLGAVRWADDAVLFHDVDQAGGSAVADSQAPLQS
jgi:hypothetical protein